MSPYPRRKLARGKRVSDGNIPQWQLAIGGIFMTLGGLLAGVKLAEIAFSIWMPGVLR